MCAGLVAVGVIVLAVGSYANGSHDDREDRGSRFSARLLGYEEVPAVSSTGTATFVARLNEDGNIEYRLTYRNLEGTPITASHIHLGQRAANGGVSAFLCGGGDKPVCPQVTPLTPQGVVEGEIDPADVIGPTAQGIAPGEFAELVRAMRAGATYANIHTGKHPGGEIRGQIELHDRGHDDHH
jgi:CHRD domain-containing protein